MDKTTALTEEDKEKLKKLILTDMEQKKENLSLTSIITKAFEKEGWKMNEYWERDEDVICASFIDYELEQISVFIDVEREDING